MTSTASSKQAPCIIQVSPQQELRLQVQEKTMSIELIQGEGEIFGAALPRTVAFEQGARFGIYSATGCSLKITGATRGYMYTSSFDSTKYSPREDILKLSQVLNTLRQQGQKTRVMVCGPTNSGRHSIAKTLVNLSLRQLPSQVVVADIDTRNNMLTLPGCIGAVSVESPIPIETGFTLLPPIVYWIGSHSQETISTTLSSVYKKQLNNLAQSVEQRLATVSNNERHCGGGLVLCAAADGPLGPLEYEYIIQQFEIDTVVVIYDDFMARQFQQLQQTGKLVRVVHLSSNSGVVRRTTQQRNAESENSIRKYFYGDQVATLPQAVVLGGHRLELKFQDVSILKLESFDLPQHLTVYQTNPTTGSSDHIRVKAQPIDNSLLHKIGAVCWVDGSVDGEFTAIKQSNIAGFLRLQEINVQKQLIVALVPMPCKALPSKYILVGDVTWIDFIK